MRSSLSSRKATHARAVGGSLLAMSVAACTSVSPVGMMRLSQVDPLALDPAALSVAIDLPSALHLRDGDATLRLAVEGRLDETFVLDVDGVPEHAVAPAAAGRHVVLAGIGAEDHERFASSQATARAVRASRGRAKGSMTVSVTGGCRSAPVGSSDLYAAISIRTAETYFPLASVDLRKALGTGDLEGMRACDARVPQRTVKKL